MRIANNLITSIACFRKHFDFHAVWSQLKIFLRDMSPIDIVYPDATSELLYHIIKDPKLVEVVGNQIVVRGTNNNVFTINDAAFLQLSALKKESYEDCIRIVALFELAGQQFEVESLSNEEFSLEGAKDIVLSNGHSLKVVEQDYTSLDLVLRQIKVDSKSFCSSIVDGVEIQPGKFAYGVFSKLGLHKVLSPVAENDVYRLRISVNASGVTETIVHNKSDGTQSHMLNVKSFCIIGRENFAYIENQMVYSLHNEALAKKIRDAIGFFNSPLFVRADDNKLIITMKDGSVIFINI